jgi:hypothetical protein
MRGERSLKYGKLGLGREKGMKKNWISLRKN